MNDFAIKNKKFVYYIANRLGDIKDESFKEDVIQEGLLELCRISKEENYNKYNRGYLYKRVRTAMQLYRNKNRYLCTFPKHIAEKLGQLRNLISDYKDINSLEEKNKIKKSLKFCIADNTLENIDNLITDSLEIGDTEVSSNENNILDILDEHYTRLKRIESINKVFNSLPEKSKHLIYDRYFSRDKIMTFKELAKKYNISISRADEIEKKFFKKVRLDMEV